MLFACLESWGLPVQLSCSAEVIWCQEEPKNMGAWSYASISESADKEPANKDGQGSCFCALANRSFWLVRVWHDSFHRMTWKMDCLKIHWGPSKICHNYERRTWEGYGHALGSQFRTVLCGTHMFHESRLVVRGLLCYCLSWLSSSKPVEVM